MANTHIQATGGGSGPRIKVDVDEITFIYQQIESILIEFEENVLPNIEQLSELTFYEAGKAKETMDAYKEANAKILEIYQHYDRAATLVIDTLNKMMATDREIAMEIIEKLGLE